MSGPGFYRGTSHEQTPFFKNKEAKMLESKNWPPEFLSYCPNFANIQLDFIKKWVSSRIASICEAEDEILSDFVMHQLLNTPGESISELDNTSEMVSSTEIDASSQSGGVDPRKLTVSLTGFMERDAPLFVLELWRLLKSAEEGGGVPASMVDEQAALKKKKTEDAERLKREISAVERNRDRGRHPVSDGRRTFRSENNKDRDLRDDESWKRHRDDFRSHRDDDRGRFRDKDKDRDRDRRQHGKYHSSPADEFISRDVWRRDLRSSRDDVEEGRDIDLREKMKEKRNSENLYSDNMDQRSTPKRRMDERRRQRSDSEDNDKIRKVKDRDVKRRRLSLSPPPREYQKIKNRNKFDDYERSKKYKNDFSEDESRRTEKSKDRQNYRDKDRQNYRDKDRQIDRDKDRQIDRDKDRQIDRDKDRQIDRDKDKQSDRDKDRQIDRDKDRRIDRGKERQDDRDKNKQNDRDKDKQNERDKDRQDDRDKDRRLRRAESPTRKVVIEQNNNLRRKNVSEDEESPSKEVPKKNSEENETEGKNNNSEIESSEIVLRRKALAAVKSQKNRGGV